MKQVIILRGISGSGKSTAAETFRHESNAYVISSDQIRAELGDIADQSRNKEVFHIFNVRYLNALDEGVEMVILDATNVNASNVCLYALDAHKRGYHVSVMTININLDDAVNSVQRRADSGGLFVPQWVITKQKAALESGTKLLDDMVLEIDPESEWLHHYSVHAD